MGFLGKIVGEALVPDLRAADPAHEQSGGWADVFRGEPTVSGRAVSVNNALGVASVWAAIRLLSDSVGMLPLIVYRKDGEGRQRATTSRAANLLHNDPNPEMTAMTLWSIVTTHLNAWGNAYLGKTFRGATVAELWPIRPDRVKVSRENGVKVFRLTDENGTPIRKTYTAREIIHLHGLTLDGMLGLSPIGMARESIGAALAMDEYANSFFREGAMPRMVLKHKKELTSVAKRNLRRDWERKYRGSRNANRVAVLEEDMDVKTLSLPQRDLEFMQQRTHSVQEIARWFRVPASKLEGTTGDSNTYSSVEMDSLHFVVYSLAPWLARIEQALNRDPDLFPTRRLYSEFLIDGLLRADTKSRYDAYKIALDPISGWMKPSEVRRLENLPPDSSFDTIQMLERQVAQEPVPEEEIV